MASGILYQRDSRPLDGRVSPLMPFFTTQAAQTGARAARHGRRRLDWLLLLPPAAALALFAAGNRNFGFDPPGWLDAFIYVGYFWHYPEHLPIFDEYYKASRLPWVLPGFVAHRLFGEIAGSYLLQWFTLTGGGLALYLLLRDTLEDRVIAAVMAVAWVCSTRGHGVGGWNYHMLAAAAYYLLTCWLVVRTAVSTTGRHIGVLAGVALACAVHAHVFYLVFVPLLVPLYLVSQPPALPQRWRRAALDAARLVAGGLAITVVLGVINGATGGAWLFFMPQVQYTLWISQPGNNAWWFDAAQWLPAASYLVIPVLCIVAGAVSLVRRAGVPDRIRLLFVLQGCAALAIFSYYQFVARQSVLDHDYMAFGLYGHAFPALGAAMCRPHGRDTVTKEVLVVALSVALMLGSLLAGLPATAAVTLNALAAPLHPHLPEVAGILAAGLAGVMVASVVPGRVAVLALALWFTVMNVWVAPSAGPYGIGTPGVQRSMMKLFREADRFTAGLDPSLDGIEYWFASETVPTSQGPVDLAAVFDSYVSTRGWSANLLLTKSPGIPIDDLEVEALEGVSCIGLLSSVSRHDALRRELVHRFEGSPRALREVGERHFATSDLEFALTVFKPASGDAPAAGGSRVHPCQP